MHIAHQMMKMTAPARAVRQAVEKQIHQPGLAAADAAPQINATWTRVIAFRPQALADAAEESGVSLSVEQLQTQLFEPAYRRALRRVGLPVALGNFTSVTRR